MNGAPQGSTYRELKTVLFADVAGYARLTESDEELTHSNLCARYSLISNLIRHHNGVIHRTEGDSVLATFISATSALQCAVEIQNTSSEQNQDLLTEENICFRIGINCGEVLIDSDEAFGNCVNIAKRLESLATPGEILFSEPFFTHVHRTLPYKYKYLGKKNFKNILNSLKVYSISLNQGSLITNYFSELWNRAKDSFVPISAFAVSATFALFLTQQLDIKGILYDGNSIPDYAETTTHQSKHIELISHTVDQKPSSKIAGTDLESAAQKKIIIYEAQAKFDAYEDAQNQLTKKYELQNKLLNDFEKQNQTLLTQQEEMSENFTHFEKKLTEKNNLINSYADKNNALIDANRALLTRLDDVVSKQALNTYENLYAEYNPVRQQIIDIIESQPKKLGTEENIPNCSIYTNEAVKPHSLVSTQGSTREELQCITSKNEHAPIPQSKLSEPNQYKKELAPKEKKVIIYAYVPKLPHKTTKITQSINKNIVELYKTALSHSSLQSYKTDFVLLSPPASGKNLAEIDIEHCNLYKADYVASVRLNSPTNYNLPVSSALVIHDCVTEASTKRNTRHLLSDSWKSDGGLYLTPSTLDSFNIQVNSVVELALNDPLTPEHEL